MEQKKYFDCLLGRMVIVEKDGAVSQLHVAAHFDPPGISEGESPLLKEAAGQLKDYFFRKRRDFDLPLAPEGTAFQRRVWDALCTIPYGETWSYRQLAQAVGNPKACRAVGGANGKNPIMIIIPCHRVIAADGSLGGYSGGLSIKTALLELEQGF